MRSNGEAFLSRVAILACGAMLFFSACGGGGGKGGQGGAKTDGGDARTDSGGGGQGGRTDGGAGGASTDAGAGGRGTGGAATDAGVGGQNGDASDSGAGGFALSLPWHAFLPLDTAAPGSGTATGTINDVTANHYDATYFGTTIRFANGALNLTGLGAELVLVPAKNGVPAVDVTGSYSVSVWATLANTGGYRTVVAGEGVNVASFYLQKRMDTNAFAFAVYSADSTTSTACIVPDARVDAGSPPSPVTPVANTQYHLVATRDATTGTNVLYVNGVESGRRICAAGWADTGILGIGHGVFGGGRGDNVQGSLAELGVINRALTPTEVADLYARGRAFGPPDAGTDAGADTTPDTAADTAPDRAPDTAPDTATDTAPDAPAGEVAPTDAGTDTAAADAPADLETDGG